MKMLGILSLLILSFSSQAESSGPHLYYLCDEYSWRCGSIFEKEDCVFGEYQESEGIKTMYCYFDKSYSDINECESKQLKYVSRSFTPWNCFKKVWQQRLSQF